MNSGFRQSAQAVERPNAPLPTMMTDLGTLGVDEVEEDIAQQRHTATSTQTTVKNNCKVNGAKSTLRGVHPGIFFE